MPLLVLDVPFSPGNRKVHRPKHARALDTGTSYSRTRRIGQAHGDDQLISLLQSLVPPEIMVSSIKKKSNCFVLRSSQRYHICLFRAHYSSGKNTSNDLFWQRCQAGRKHSFCLPSLERIRLASRDL